MTQQSQRRVIPRAAHPTAARLRRVLLGISVIACGLLATLIVAGYFSNDPPIKGIVVSCGAHWLWINRGHVDFYFGRLPTSMFVTFSVDLWRSLVFCAAVTVLLWIDKGYWLGRLLATSWFNRLAFFSVVLFGLSLLLWYRSGELFSIGGTMGWATWSRRCYLGVWISEVHSYGGNTIYVRLGWPLLLALTLLSGIAPTWWLVRRKQRRGQPFQC